MPLPVNFAPLTEGRHGTGRVRSQAMPRLVITRPDFGANAETGLGPLLAGHDIQEVPISWINRTDDMGTSDFRILRFAPSYLRALIRVLRASPRRRRT